MNGWTGGQYSLFRILLATYLFVHFAELLPWGAELFSNHGVIPDAKASPLIRFFPNVLLLSDSPAVVTALLAAATGLSVLFALGLGDRLAAVGMWYTLACLFGRNPLIANPSLPFVGWILLAHLALPRAPYGSWAARGAPDARAGWRMPQPLFVAAWIVMALGYSYSGYTKLISPSWVDGTALAHVLDNPLARPGLLRDLLLATPAPLLRLATWSGLALELGFAPLALVRWLRPYLWAALLGMHVGLLTLIDFADLSLGMVVLHAFTFDPGWIRRRGTAADAIFYDGHCGLCHGFVRFVLSEDRTGTAFRFAALDSAAFHTTVAAAERVGLPDSVVVRTPDGRLLTRSTAMVHVLQGLGGVWRLLGWLIERVPRGARDRVYDAIARVRRRLLKRPVDQCPVMARDLRTRFDS